MEVKEVLRKWGFKLPYKISHSEIKRAYRIRAKALHPDSSTGDAYQFKVLSEEYAFLKSLDDGLEVSFKDKSDIMYGYGLFGVIKDGKYYSLIN